MCNLPLMYRNRCHPNIGFKTTTWHAESRYPDSGAWAHCCALRNRAYEKPPFGSRIPTSCCYQYHLTPQVPLVSCTPGGSRAPELQGTSSGAFGCRFWYSVGSLPRILISGNAGASENLSQQSCRVCTRALVVISTVPHDSTDLRTAFRHCMHPSRQAPTQQMRRANWKVQVSWVLRSAAEFLQPVSSEPMHSTSTSQAQVAASEAFTRPPTHVMVGVRLETLLSTTTPHKNVAWELVKQPRSLRVRLVVATCICTLFNAACFVIDTPSDRQAVEIRPFFYVSH